MNGASFYNPYAFVPADRSMIAPEPGPVGELGEGPPAPLGRLRPDRWTGRLRITLTAEAPLLLTEVREIDGDGHTVRKTRRDPGGHDLAELLATAVKGMLRSGYEAATNSRFGVFADHGRLTRRAGTEEAANLVPALAVSKNGAVTVALLMGSVEPKEDGKRGIQCAIRVPRYHGETECNVDPAGVRHGARATALVAAFTKGQHRTKRVVEIVPRGSQPDRAAADRRARALAAKLRSQFHGRIEVVDGWYYETGNTIKVKEDERFFYHDEKRHGGSPPTLDVADEVVAAWQVVMDSYRDRRDQTLQRPDADAPESSPFVADEDEFRAWRELSRPTLCYAGVRGRQVSEYVVTALYPVAISRRMYPRSPAQQARKQRVIPAENEQEASPADRVFGWAASGSARRGRVRVGTPAQRPGSEVVRLNGADGVPLAVLSSPVPSYELFYAGKPDGSPGRLGEGFGEGGGLRGRKVYPAHPRNADRWRPDGSQPWSRAENDRGSTNASLLDWVPPGTVFDVDVFVEDLTEVELGALLWLLRPDRRHRIGLGRPLGFGTVHTKVDWQRSLLRDGAGWRAHYRLEPMAADGTGAPARLAERCVQAFEQAMEKLYGERRPRFLAALERALAGFPDSGPSSLPIQYPRNPNDANGMGDHFEWFVINSGVDGAKHALGDLGRPWRDLRLPVNPAGRGRPRRRRA